MRPPAGIDKTLSQASLFEALSGPMLLALAERGTTLDFAAGETVCHEGEPALSMYVVVDGKVRVYRTGDDGTERVELARLGPGSMFGELAMFDGKPRSASVEACGASCVFRVEKDAFMEMLTSSHSRELMEAVLRGLILRVRAMNERVLVRELEQRTVRAELEASRHRVMAEMLAGAAHELNTPLGVANTGASIVRSRLEMSEVQAALDSDEETRDAREDMLDAATLIGRNLSRAHKLVETLKRVSVDHVAEKRETVDLSLLVTEIYDLFRLHGRKTGLEVVVDDQLGPDEGRWDGYPGYLIQALTNLLFNAERHAYPDGGGRVVVRVAAKGDDFRLSVSDTGRGMDEETLARIYTPFFTTARDRGGTGLGLAIVLSAVSDGLGGRLEVVSAPGEGTTFTIVIPRSAPHGIDEA